MCVCVCVCLSVGLCTYCTSQFEPLTYAVGDHQLHNLSLAGHRKLQSGDGLGLNMALDEENIYSGVELELPPYMNYDPTAPSFTPGKPHGLCVYMYVCVYVCVCKCAILCYNTVKVCVHMIGQRMYIYILLTASIYLSLSSRSSRYPSTSSTSQKNLHTDWSVDTYYCTHCLSFHVFV